MQMFHVSQVIWKCEPCSRAGPLVDLVVWEKRSFARMYECYCEWLLPRGAGFLLQATVYRKSRNWVHRECGNQRQAWSSPDWEAQYNLHSVHSWLQDFSELGRTAFLGLSDWIRRPSVGAELFDWITGLYPGEGLSLVTDPTFHSSRTRLDWGQEMRQVLCATVSEKNFFFLFYAALLAMGSRFH